MDKDNTKQNKFYDKEIDLSLIFNTLVRNKYLIFALTSFVFIISCIHATFKTKTWEGQFQIVLESESSNNPLKSSLLDSGFASGLLFTRRNSDDLLTQIGILKSPSVLMPIFNFVNEEYKNNNKGSRDLIFSGWKKKLKVNLVNDTKILNITYKDSNKDTIIPVLNMISEEYKNYAVRRKGKDIEKTREYLIKQVNLFNKESASSLRKVQDFGYEQDLTLIDPNYSLNPQYSSNKNVDQKTMSSSILSNLEIEYKRVKAANEIRTISRQIEKIEELKNNPQELQYFCSTIEGLKEAGLLQFLENIENELVNLRSIYTDKDPKIKLFLKDRDIAVKTLKERSISYLKAKRKALEAEKEASMRPKGVILKYKELLREANRNEKTLVSLENQLKQINLESEVQPTPWELITKPTLNQFAVEPNKRTIALSGLIIGFFLSMAIVIFKEKRSGLIYEEVELENILNTKVIKRITFDGGDIKEFEYESPFSEILYEPKKIINMIYPSKNINQDDLEKIQNAIPSFDKKIKFVDLNRSLNELENIFLILSEKLLTYNEINSLHDRLELSNKKIKGIILIK